MLLRLSDAPSGKVYLLLRLLKITNLSFAHSTPSDLPIASSLRQGHISFSEETIEVDQATAVLLKHTHERKATLTNQA